MRLIYKYPLIACFILLLSLFLNACQASSHHSFIHTWPITFDEERMTLTKRYLAEHYDIHQNDIHIKPKMIVIHWTAQDSLQKTYDSFKPSALLGFERPDLPAKDTLNVSAHFLVDQDGTVYQLMPDNWMARHVIGLNHLAIGIENVGGANEQENLTEAQLKANVKIIRYLTKKYPDIRYVIGHYEYPQFRGTSLWKERDPNYATNKVDPGTKFMHALRAHLTSLGLKGAPISKNSLKKEA